jgi:hypothetical protein
MIVTVARPRRYVLYPRPVSAASVRLVLLDKIWTQPAGAAFPVPVPEREPHVA